MDVKLRPGVREDAAACGRICYEAFEAVSSRHGFPCDFPSAEASTGLASMMLSHPGFFSLVAESEGRVLGSNFLDERSVIAGVGPITVDPAVQDAGIGRQLMIGVMERAEEAGFAGVRLLQAAYHGRSLALYSTLGFEVREPVACLQGRPPRVSVPGYGVRDATAADAEACNAICRRVHGHDRGGELSDAIAEGSALVVEQQGQLSGYSTGLAFFGHSVAETTDGLKALIGAAPEFGGPGVLVPARDTALLRWCLGHGLRIVQVMTLMTTGLYNDPVGSYLPSIAY